LDYAAFYQMGLNQIAASVASPSGDATNGLASFRCESQFLPPGTPRTRRERKGKPERKALRIFALFAILAVAKRFQNKN
ncbi:MAG: hypothetical protein KDE50_03765, partial [Caldilineaceae bacterium]|nr:hypothetical protein [Caldilineaceae bacterium]